MNSTPTDHAVDLFSIYLGSYFAALRSQPHNFPPGVDAKEQLAVTLGAEDAGYMIANASNNEVEQDALGFRRRYEVLAIIAKYDRAEPPPEDEGE